MIPVPTEQRALVSFVQELVEICRVSVGYRTLMYAQLNRIAETGRYEGAKSLINLMQSHLLRTAAHLFSPVELKFSIDFENTYPKEWLDRGAVVARLLTRSWERTNTDTTFGQGVFEGLKYGACILKQWPEVEGPEDKQVVTYNKKLVLPWNFGVYNESETDINKQPALCETTTMTLPEIWRRIYHLPDAKKLFNRVKSLSRKGQAMSEPQSYFHQVLSTSTLDTGINGSTTNAPGGIMQLTNEPNYSMMSPVVAADVVTAHELWVQDETDYTTILFVEPDIIIAPLFQKSNLLGVQGQQPYTLIQPNEVTNWFWGRSELVDLVEPQALLSQWADDVRRLFGLQIDKIMAFIGEDGLTDEKYDQFRQAGWMSMGPNGKVQDLTPQMPSETMSMLKFVIDIINMIGSFPEIMQGKGESGVRAGVHANTLLKTASPTLRDRALLVERQCAIAADKSLEIREAKDAQIYWTKGETHELMKTTAFKLTDLPKDWRVTVDSHSSSPIFSDENSNLVMAAHKMGIAPKEYVIDTLAFPNKENLKALAEQEDKKKAAQFQELLKANPELGEKILQRQMTGGRR